VDRGEQRDELGSDRADYLTSVVKGGYGWPYSYGHHVDARVQPPRPGLVRKAIKPDYALGAHAPLASRPPNGRRCPRATRTACSSDCGSWNRRRSALRGGVRAVPGASRQACQSGLGFVNAEGDARRPVGVAIDARRGTRRRRRRQYRLARLRGQAR
jgi:glucose/arabinose dehydrogenase